MPESVGQEEMFDVVDENDTIVARATRREVHARGWRHRAVHVLVFNRAGDLFLQKRSMNKDVAPGSWDSSTSGHLGVGEDYDAGAVRELEEEIGLRVDQAPHRWLRLPACAESGQEFVWVYRARGGRTIHPEPGRDRTGRVVCARRDRRAGAPEPGAIRHLLPVDLAESGGPR